MSNYFREIFKHYAFVIGVGFILLLAVVLRFTNYTHRWGLAYDQAHDALVARYALREHKIPLVGPFSSAGPFQTGGQWYWFIMLATSLYPHSVITPWVFLTALSVLFVFLMIIVGKELVNQRFGLIAGLLAAVSTAQIAQSVNLTNQSPLAIVSLLALWSAIRYIRSGRPINLFWLGLFTGSAAAIHLQGATLIILVLTTLVMRRPHLGGVAALGVGLFIPLVPILLFDIQHKFVTTQGVLAYYLRGQYTVSFEQLGRRWLTYIGIFWPKQWAHVIGGNDVLGYALIILAGASILWGEFKKELPKEFRGVWISLVGMILVIRYIRTPLFASYLVFLHPFVLFFTSWVVEIFMKRRRALGIAFVAFITLGSIWKDIPEITKAENFTAIQAAEWKGILTQKFPREKFSVFDHRYNTVNKSLAMGLYLDVEGKIDESGRKVGVAIATISGEFRVPILVGGLAGYQVVDLSSSDSAVLSAAKWIRVNPKDIYLATEEWVK